MHLQTSCKVRTKLKVMQLDLEVSVKTVLSFGEFALTLAFPFSIPFHCLLKVWSTGAAGRKTRVVSCMEHGTRPFRQKGRKAHDKTKT